MTKPCPGPNPPSAPRLKAPPKACDSHMHIVGPAAKFPFSEERGYTAPDSPLEAYLEFQDTMGLERMVIVHPSCYGTDLAVTEDAVTRMGDRARGVAVVKPDIGDTELDRLEEIGFRGLRFTTLLKGGAAVEEISHMADRIERLGWHVQLFIDGPAQLAEMAPMLRDLPVDVVIDHMGHFPPEAGIDHPGFQALLGLMRGGRCWAKLSGSYRVSNADAPWSDMPPYAEALIDAAPDHVVWASDWPHVMLWDKPMPESSDLLDWVTTWNLDDAALNRILVENPAALYRF